MSNVSVEYLVLRDNVEYSRLTACKGGGAAISVTADAAVKWALSGKFAQNSDVNYLTDVIQPVLTIDGVRRPLGKYIPTDAYTEHDGMRPVVSLTAYDLTYLARSSKIETRLHLAKGTLYTAAIQALLVESGITDFFVEENTATLQADREDWEPGTDRLTIINALAAEINYNSIWMDGGGTVHCSAFRMPSADAISVTYRDGEYSVQYPEWTQAVDLFDLFRDFYRDFDYEKAVAMCRSLGVEPRSRLKTMSKGTKEKVQLILVMSREAQLYLLDEPIGGVDPAARDYILNTIIANYNENATVLISTHLISDVEQILDDVIFINQGSVVLTSSVDDIREKQDKSVDALFREVFRC